MNKLLAKLIASILALTVAATLVAMSSYAWLTISNTPEINGIQINIGGSNTLMIAPDQIVQNADGSISHYPGVFGSDLSFGSHNTYSYLNSLAGLLPVSTADGINWVVPDFYDETDVEVQNGTAQPGQLKGQESFIVDNTLFSANLTPEQQSNSTTGNYIYLDFWVVAPAEDFTLRISTGNDQDGSGSFVISRMEPVEGENGVWTLVAADDAAAASVRIGFLVNQAWADSADVENYKDSRGYDDRFTRLLGLYQEPGEPAVTESVFTIYEPNGNLHPQNPEDSSYYITQPLGVVDGVTAPTDISRLSVQMANRWKTANNGTSTLLEQEFTAAFYGKDMSDMSAEELVTKFYKKRLQGLYAPYIDRGGFVKNTNNLYASAVDGVVASDAPELHALTGATDDAVIAVLPKNVPQRIRMFIWLEGQDVDCVGQKTASNLIVNLELAGSNSR